jgi:hypothetical protein
MDRDGHHRQAAAKAALLSALYNKTGLSLRRIGCMRRLVRRLSCNFDRRPRPRPRPRAFSSPSALSFTLPYQWTLQLARRPILVLFLVVRPPLSGLYRPIPNETLVTLVSFYPDFPQTPSLRLLSYNETPSL